MKPILTIKERVSIKKYYLAYEAFRYAIAQVDFVTENRYKFGNDVLYINAISIIFILYSRPFTNNKKIGKLSEKLIPSELKQYHKEMILYRDKLIAHSDLDGHLLDDETANLIDITIQVKKKETQWQMTTPFPDILELNKFKELISFLMKCCYEKIFEISDKYVNANLDLPDGKYGLNITNEAEFDFYKIL